MFVYLPSFTLFIFCIGSFDELYSVCLLVIGHTVFPFVMPSICSNCLFCCSKQSCSLSQINTQCDEFDCKTPKLMSQVCFHDIQLYDVRMRPSKQHID